MFEYKTKGTCSQKMMLDIDDDGVIRECRVVKGCTGNLQGISRLVVGRHVDEVIDSLSGIRCPGADDTTTSCPDQLANALKEWKATKAHAG